MIIIEADKYNIFKSIVAGFPKQPLSLAVNRSPNFSLADLRSLTSTTDTRNKRIKEH